MEQINAFYAQPGVVGLTREELRSRLAEERAKLHAIELDEAMLFWNLVNAGVDVPPRKDISSKAFLLITD